MGDTVYLTYKVLKKLVDEKKYDLLKDALLDPKTQVNNLNETDDYGITIFIHLLIVKQQELALLLLDKSNPLLLGLDKTDYNGNTALQIAIMTSSHEVVMRLLNLPPKVTRLTNKNRAHLTTLMLTIKVKMFDISMLLLDKYSDYCMLNEVDWEGNSALSLSIMKKRTDIALKILEQFSLMTHLSIYKPNADGITPFHYAVLSKNSEIVLAMLDKFANDLSLLRLATTVGRNGNNAIMSACFMNMEEATLRLLDLLVEKESPSVVRNLLERVNIRGENAMYIACNYGLKSVCERTKEILDRLGSSVPEMGRPPLCANREENMRDSVITVIIGGHGSEFFHKDLTDLDISEEVITNTRVLSMAGLVGHVGWVCETCEEDNTCSQEKFVSEAQQIFDEPSNSNKSTFEILEELSKIYKVIYERNLTAIINSNAPDALHIPKTIKSLETEQYCHLLVPQHEKMFYLNTPKDDIIQSFIKVINVRNYTDNPDNILSPESYIRQKLERTNTFTLSDIIKYFNSIGFETINIIDLTCRSSYGYQVNLPEEEEERMTIREAEALQKTNKTRGGKRRRRRQKTRKHKR